MFERIDKQTQTDPESPENESYLDVYKVKDLMSENLGKLREKLASLKNKFESVMSNIEYRSPERHKYYDNKMEEAVKAINLLIPIIKKGSQRLIAIKNLLDDKVLSKEEEDLLDIPDECLQGTKKEDTQPQLKFNP